MKLKILKIIQNFYKSRALILVLGVIMSIPTLSQSFGEKNKIILIGQVTRKDNGGPIKGQKVTISADTLYEPHFNYGNIVYTDEEGYYYDTINVNEIKGALYVRTVDFQHIIHDTTVYFRFNWSLDNILFANFRLPVKPAPLSYQANFEYTKFVGSQNEPNYHFTDLSNSSLIISWLWNFGDGTFSTEQNPDHTYAETGIYRVKLTIKIKSEIVNEPIESSIVKILNVKSRGYFHMGGHVMAGYFPIDLGHAFLYKIENNELVMIDTAEFNDPLGYYYFYQLIEGEYIVKADLDPSSKLFNQFHATYYSNKIHWSEADTIHHHTTNFDYDIHLKPYNLNMAGPGKIGGLVTYGFIPGKSKAVPADNVEIILFDKSDNTRKICHSNSDGIFTLEGLDLQMYYIYAEVTGKYTFPLQIQLDENNNQLNFIKITIGSFGVNGSVSSGIGEEGSRSETVGQIYPNPVSDDLNLNVSFNQPAQVKFIIYSSTGSEMLSSTEFIASEGNTMTFSTSNLVPGNYIILVNCNGTPVAARKFIKE